MVKALDEDQLRRKKALEEKRAARKKAKAEKDAAAKAALAANGSDKADQHDKSKTSNQQQTSEQKPKDDPSLENLPEYAISSIFTMLTAAEVGRLAGTCKALMQHQVTTDTRAAFLVARCRRSDTTFRGRVRDLNLCGDANQAAVLLQDAYRGGETGRILPRGKYAKKVQADFWAYARFLEEIAAGESTLSTGNRRDPITLPRFVQGRFASVSPEHSICRVGGGGKQSGAGGSGVASWGVGKRGQLGHGKRQDERLPRRLLGGLGYGIRIVQVSAGGGLVRVAHTLLLTSTGRVMSFGIGQYGALGHGYSAAKQLPDVLKPRYIEALNGVRCINVAAGELHSAAVTSDGDLYTWGDGFCGQLGHGDRKPQTVPIQVTKGDLDDEIIANVTCGSRHTIAVTEEGEVFSFGLGRFGQLGRTFTPFDHDAEAALANLEAEEDEGMGLEFLPNLPEPQPAPVVPVEAAVAANNDGGIDAEIRAQIDFIANLSLDDSSTQCLPLKIESLQGIKIVGACAGHRHSLLLDEHGALYSCGAGVGGCLGHGDAQPQMYPMKIMAFEDENIKVVQMSAGVDMCMAVSSAGDVYAWGKQEGGRIGLGLDLGHISLPRKIDLKYSDGRPIKAADVECGYVHSIIVALDGTIHMCGQVGVDGEADGEKSTAQAATGTPHMVPDFNIWHRQNEPQEEVAKKEKWKKYGKYEVKGRSKMLSNDP